MASIHNCDTNIAKGLLTKSADAKRREILSF